MLVAEQHMAASWFLVSKLTHYCCRSSQFLWIFCSEFACILQWFGVSIWWWVDQVKQFTSDLPFEVVLVIFTFFFRFIVLLISVIYSGYDWVGFLVTLSWTIYNMCELFLEISTKFMDYYSHKYRTFHLWRSLTCLELAGHHKEVISIGPKKRPIEIWSCRHVRWA